MPKPLLLLAFFARLPELSYCPSLPAKRWRTKRCYTPVYLLVLTVAWNLWYQFHAHCVKRTPERIRTSNSWFVATWLSLSLQVRKIPRRPGATR
jgi:hypothetical protein